MQNPTGSDRPAGRAERAPLNRAELITAALVGALGLFVIREASGYPLGTLARMGTGFVPLALGVMLVALAFVIALGERRNPERTDRIAPRVLVAVGAALLAWALLVDRAGLIAANGALVGLASLAEPGFRPLRALLIFVALTAIGYGVFILGLRVPIRMIQG